jgi:hypothetical protein
MSIAMKQSQGFYITNGITSLAKKVPDEVNI